MKFATFLFLSILFSSCNEESSQNSNFIQTNEDWRISTSSVTRQTYNSIGLTDTSYETVYSYKMGIPVDSVKSIIVRQYDNNNRNVNEKDLLMLPNGSKEVSSEITKKFDENGNELLAIGKLDGEVEFRYLNEYNSENQLMKRVDLSIKRDENRKRGTIHNSIYNPDKKIPPRYDTSISSYQYDEIGNQIGCITSSVGGTIITSIITQYFGVEKVSKIRKNLKGDTVSQTIYKHVGDLVMQITKDDEFGNVDSVWYKGGKIIKIIGHNYKRGTKHKTETTYNDKGDQIERFTYR